MIMVDKVKKAVKTPAKKVTLVKKAAPKKVVAKVAAKKVVKKVVKKTVKKAAPKIYVDGSFDTTRLKFPRGTHIQNDQVDVLLCDFDRLFSVSCGQGTVPLFLKIVLEEFEDILFIINDKNSLLHVSSGWGFV